MPGVKKPQFEVLVLQHVVEGLPVHPRCLHPHQLYLKGSQPVPKIQEPSCRGGELPRLLIGFFALAGCDPNAGGYGGFMHIETGAAFDYPLQNPSPSFAEHILGVVAEGSLLWLWSLVCVLNSRQQFGVPKRLPRHADVRALGGTSPKPTSIRRRLRVHFHGFGVALPRAMIC